MSVEAGDLRIVFAQVGHRFGRRVLFANLGGELAPGDVLVVSGSNGSGKSTLLKLIAGLIRPAAGAVEWRVGPRLLSQRERRLRLGYVAPDGLPYRALTVRENLEFFARVRGSPAPLDPAVVALVGLAERLDQPVAELSSGYIQRVKLAVALVGRPAVLLLDEPSVTLDDEGQAQVAAVVARQRAGGGICLVAANDPRDKAYGTRYLNLGG